MRNCSLRWQGGIFLRSYDSPSQSVRKRIDTYEERKQYCNKAAQRQLLTLSNLVLFQPVVVFNVLRAKMKATVNCRSLSYGVLSSLR